MASPATCPQCGQPALSPSEPCPACGFVPRVGESAGRSRRAAAFWAAFDALLLGLALAAAWFYAPPPAGRQDFAARVQVEAAGPADVLVNARQEFVVGETTLPSAALAAVQTLSGAAGPAQVRIRAERGALVHNVLQLAAELARAGATQVSVELPAP